MQRKAERKAELAPTPEARDEITAAIIGASGFLTDLELGAAAAAPARLNMTLEAAVEQVTSGATAAAALLASSTANPATVAVGAAVAAEPPAS